MYLFRSALKPIAIRVLYFDTKDTEYLKKYRFREIRGIKSRMYAPKRPNAHIHTRTNFLCITVSFLKTHKTMTEKYIENRLKTEVKKLGGIAVKFVPVSFNGIPDRIVLMPGGKVFFIELKRPGKLPTAIQFFVMRKLIKLGFTVLVINSIEALNEFIKSIKHDL